MARLVQPKGVIQWRCSSHETFVHYAMEPGKLFTPRALKMGTAGALYELRRESLKGIISDKGKHLRPKHILELKDEHLNGTWLSQAAIDFLWNKVEKRWGSKTPPIRSALFTALDKSALYHVDDDELYPVLQTECDRDIEDPAVWFVYDDAEAPPITARFFMKGATLLADYVNESLTWPVDHLMAAVAGWWGIRPESMEQYASRVSFLNELGELDEELASDTRAYLEGYIVDDIAEAKVAKERAEVERVEGLQAQATADRLKREGAAAKRKDQRDKRALKKTVAEANDAAARRAARKSAPEVTSPTKDEASALDPRPERRTPSQELPAVSKPAGKAESEPEVFAESNASKLQRFSRTVTPASPIASLLPKPEKLDSKKTAKPVKRLSFRYDGGELTVGYVRHAIAATVLMTPAYWHERMSGIISYGQRLSAVSKTTGMSVDMLAAYLSDKRNMFAIGLADKEGWAADFIGYDENSPRIAMMAHLDSWIVFARLAEEAMQQETPIEGYYNFMRFIGTRGEGGFNHHIFPATYASMFYRMKLEDGYFQGAGLTVKDSIGLPPLPPFARRNY